MIGIDALDGQEPNIGCKDDGSLEILSAEFHAELVGETYWSDRCLPVVLEFFDKWRPVLIIHLLVDPYFVKAFRVGIRRIE